ncbi:hypothetical protein D9M68_785390 [compost metagenome]
MPYQVLTDPAFQSDAIPVADARPLDKVAAVPDTDAFQPLRPQRVSLKALEGPR